MGSVHGGQQPVGGAHIYILAVGTGGYGTASSSLLLPGLATAPDGTGKYFVTADANGNFSVTGDYVCTSGTQVYLYAAGGNPGGGVANPAIGLLAGLGQCPATGTLALQVPFVVINEVSTVVTAYALAGFATDPLHIASGATALGQTAVANAMATVANIVSVPQGIALTNSPSGAAANPVQNINTLANILAACINSDGGTSSACTVLLGNAASLGSSNGIVPADTATAAINLAHYPFGNINTLFNLQTASAPFQPALATVPTDFTLALYYTKTPAYAYNQANNPTGTGNTYLYSQAIAFDADGSAWVQSALVEGSGNVVTAGNYAHLSASGQVLANVNTLPATAVGAATIAIDSAGNVWGPSKTAVVELSSGGTILSPGAGYTCAGMELTTSIILGKNGVAYVGDQAGVMKIWELSETNGSCAGALSLGSNNYSGYLSTDSAGDIFAGLSDRLIKFAGGGGTAQVLPVSASSLYSATDAADDLWLLDFDASALYTYSSNGVLVSPATGYTGGGFSPPGAQSGDGNGPPVIDGGGAVWTPVYTYYGVNQAEPIVVAGIANSGTAITPAAGLQIPFGKAEDVDAIAVDGSGNLWALDGDGSLIEFLGLSTPVATPVLYNQLGKRP